MPRFTSFFLLLAFVLLHAPLARAQFSSNIIQAIQVEGVERIDSLTVKSYMGIKAGDEFSAENLDQALKNLFNTGLFADVRLNRMDGTLVVEVKENPVVNRLAFEGNKKIELDTLKNEVQLKPRMVFTRARVQADVDRLLTLYRRSGRFGATVEPKIIQLPQNRVDLVFEISEGAVTKVGRINFIGNRKFSAGTLRSEIATKESAWYRFFSSSDSYDPDRLNADRELLRRFYLRNGYVDFRVLSSVAELTPAKNAFIITFTVDEGNRYKVGDIELKSDLKNLKVDVLKDQIALEKGEWYDAGLVDKTIANLTNAAGDQGFAFVDVQAQPTQRRESKTIDFTFNIQEGSRVFIERINISGNVRTLDEVIRREFRVAEGDAYNVSKVRQARQKIQDLGFFEKVEVTNEPGAAPDRTQINVEVEEKSTGELSFGAGFSTSDKVVGDIRLRERNLLGKGQDLRLATTLSTRRTEFDIGFTEPYFLDRKLAAGFDLFHLTRDFQSESGYDERRSGGSLRMRYDISERLNQEVRYGYKQVDVRNVKPFASRFIRDQEGVNTTSSVGQTLLYDRRDSRIDPTNGYYVRFGLDVAGLGGDSQYIKPELGAGYYYPLGENTVVSLLGNAGLVEGIGKNVLITDRYFLGGSSFRGFRIAGIGPRDRSTEDALGGKYYA
ncbi:MAG: outer membrane protein assembly factor BamA, partial [Dongiaceae bacterium]